MQNRSQGFKNQDDMRSLELCGMLAPVPWPLALALVLRRRCTTPLRLDLDVLILRIRRAYHKRFNTQTHMNKVFTNLVELDPWGSRHPAHLPPSSRSCRPLPTSEAPQLSAAAYHEKAGDHRGCDRRLLEARIRFRVWCPAGRQTMTSDSVEQINDVP
jgi:hypothetical protein